MKILAIEKEIIGITKDQLTAELKKAEANRLWELYQSGKIRELYFRADRNEAVLILECIDTSEAKSVLNTLPLMKAGLIDFDIIPLKAYPGFSRLFSATTGV
ncbi:MAG TPA: muconolactone Delta-isomerase family protein [bacterium]